MNLPNSGRIALIDDNYEEAEPLIETLGKKGIAYTYYDGDLGKLPDNAPGGIRFIFLDIELQGMQGQNNKNKASGCTARIKKLISSDNGPYVIIFWTKHQEVIKPILENCEKASISPVEYLDLEKSDYINTDKSFDLKKLSENLESKLSSLGAFRLYIEWENILHSADTKFISQFSRLVPPGKNWSKDTSTLFYKLYKAYVEKYDIQDPQERFKCASSLMNRSFFDALEESVSNELQLPSGFNLANGVISPESQAKLYSWIYICEALLTRPSLGYVYKASNTNLKKSLEKALFKPYKAPASSTLCSVIITPECDLARNKNFKMSPQTGVAEEKVHRILYGLLYKSNQSEEFHDRIDHAGYVIKPIWHENKAQCLILHFETLTFQHEGGLGKQPIFALRRELVFDLQSKTANHVNRLGKLDLE